MANGACEMVRNWQTIRRILEVVESGNLQDYADNGGYSADEIDEGDFYGHVEILCDAGILKGCEIHRSAAGRIVSARLAGAFISMSGHDLLDALRDKTVWTAMLAKAKTLGVAVSWEFIKAALPVVLRDLLK
jgi:hypothetical protein